MTVNLSRLLLLVSRTQDRAPYKLGAKWPLKSASQECIGKPVDCSGYIRWLLDRCGVTLPDGSQNQWAWEEARGGHRLARYGDLSYAQHDPTRLFIAFKRATKSGHGHVWLVHDGQTIESYGNHGVGRRPWKRLERYAAACYEVPVA